MLGITVVCVGKLKEPYLRDAEREYAKRLGAFCLLKIAEADEEPFSGGSPALLDRKLLKEARAAERLIPPGARVVALCVGGKAYSSEEFANELSSAALSGSPRLCFLIGGSNGLHGSLLSRADARLSLSNMTFPHHLARIMLLEQLYRAFQIHLGTRYHK